MKNVNLPKFLMSSLGTTLRSPWVLGLSYFICEIPGVWKAWVLRLLNAHNSFGAWLKQIIAKGIKPVIQKCIFVRYQHFHYDASRETRWMVYWIPLCCLPCSVCFYFLPSGEAHIFNTLDVFATQNTCYLNDSWTRNKENGIFTMNVCDHFCSVSVSLTYKYEIVSQDKWKFLIVFWSSLVDPPCIIAPGAGV